MGHNRAWARRKLRERRRQKHERQLAEIARRKLSPRSEKLVMDKDGILSVITLGSDT